MVLNPYCEMSPSEILRVSKVPPYFQTADHRKIAEEFGQKEYRVLGNLGDCGNFAIALNRHFCNKGQLIAIQSNEYEEHGYNHVILQMGERFVDKDGVFFPNSTSPIVKKQLDAITEIRAAIDNRKKYVSTRNDLDSTLQELNEIDAINDEDGISYDEGSAISVIESNIFASLPMTKEARIARIRDYLCRIEGDFTYDSSANACVAQEKK